MVSITSPQVGRPPDFTIEQRMMRMAAERPRTRRSTGLSFELESLEARQLLSIDFSHPFYATPDTTGSATITLVRNDGKSAPTGTESGQLSVSGGSATPGVDYQPVNETVTFGPGQTSLSVTIPILSVPNGGTKTVHLTIAPSASTPTGAAAYLSIQHGPDTSAPQIINTQMQTKGRLVTGFVITFNKPMDPASVENTSNYIVEDSRTIRRVKGTMAKTAASIPLTSANYNAATNSVTLVPAIRIRRSPFYEVLSPEYANAMFALAQSTPNVTTLNLMSPITDTSGNAIDSNGDGVPDGQLLTVVATGALGRKFNSQLGASAASL